MSYPLVVRVATAEDAAALARLNAAFNGVADDADALAARLRDPRRVETPLLATWEGQAVGFAALRLTPGLFYAAPQAELTELYVAPAYRRRGIARALLREVTALAQALGAEEVWLLTNPANLAAQALYRAEGFAADDLALRKPLRNASG
jgi:ribosomal protein S18 acetylase RimI-like enzyme